MRWKITIVRWQCHVMRLTHDTLHQRRGLLSRGSNAITAWNSRMLPTFQQTDGLTNIWCSRVPWTKKKCEIFSFPSRVHVTLWLSMWGCLSIGFSVCLFVRPFISPSIGRWHCFLAFKSDFNVITPAHPHTTWVAFYPALFFCRACCFCVGLCKIMRREPGWLCQKNP